MTACFLADPEIAIQQNDLDYLSCDSMELEVMERSSRI